MPFSSSKYLYSWLRISNLVDLSFGYLSFSKKKENNHTLSQSSHVSEMAYVTCNAFHAHVLKLLAHKGLEPGASITKTDWERSSGQNQYSTFWIIFLFFVAIPSSLKCVASYLSLSSQSQLAAGKVDTCFYLVKDENTWADARCRTISKNATKKNQ